MEVLPHDIQLKIIQHFDMDTRIKCGFIHKLKIPSVLRTKLECVFSRRKCISEWYVKEFPYYICQCKAVELVIAPGKRYDFYYEGDVLYVDEENNISSLLYASHVSTHTMGFPNVDGLPRDFVQMHPEWVARFDHDYYVLKQPGAAYRDTRDKSVNTNDECLRLSWML